MLAVSLHELHVLEQGVERSVGSNTSRLKQT